MKNELKKTRPSENRRNILKANEANNNFPPISNLTPIERYYEVATKLKQLFEVNLSEHKLDNAYIYGRRFAKFSAVALPQHDYYKAPKPELKLLKRKNKKDLSNVIDSLEKVVQLMDLEELEKEEIRRREEATLRKFREQEALMRKEEEDRRAQKELTDRLNALDTMFPKTPTGVGESQTNVELPTYEQAKKMMKDMNDLPIGNDLPPPIPFAGAENGIEVSLDNTAPLPVPPSYAPPPQEAAVPPPPSYDDLLRGKSGFKNYEPDSIADLRPASSTSSRSLMTGQMSQPQINYLNNGQEPATLINPLGPLLPASLDVHGKLKQSTFKIDVPIATLKYTSKNEYSALRKMQKVQVFHLNTYQGKYNTPAKNSTNGCTVISPLVAVHHLSNMNNGAGVSDAMIEKVIDTIAPSILTKVRRKLGLDGHALIIPSDVHDFLVDEKILKQEMFVGVCGGNLLDGDHMNEFLSLLENGEDVDSGSRKNEEKKDDSKKVAAALFFHEHVVSILKVVLPDGTSWYDLVDSLPRRSSDNYDKMGATRTRCKDLDSLQSVLQWYACSKFSPADEKYIDSNQWDDNMCNFDPRVFQAFVWKE